MVHTNARTHQVILDNLDRAPMFNGAIQAQGPRYCPSIEDKIHRFQDKESHGLFLEPEGWETNEVYVQGANTSLPESVQIEMLRSIPALERAEIMRVGYAVEYDYVPPSQTRATMESKAAEGLYFAGQINGTSGYEEAAGQGLLAGINAALKSQGKPPLILGRDQAYIGVMADDLVTRELEEPYRLLTSRAEYRLLLRQDNADLRLTPIAYDLGLVSHERHEAAQRKREQTEEELRRLSRFFMSPGNGAAAKVGNLRLPPLERSVSALDYLRRPQVDYQALVEIGVGRDVLPLETRQQVEVTAKYDGYVRKQQREVDRIKRLEGWAIPPELDYSAITGLGNEARDRLLRFRPLTVGQAARIMGVNPADISVLLVHLERLRQVAAASYTVDGEESGPL